MEDEDLELEETPKPAGLSDDDQLAMALIALASTGIGGLVGGRTGAMGGAVAGGKGAGMIAQDAVDKGKDAKKAAEAEKKAKQSMSEKIGLINYEDELKNKNKKPEPPKLMTNAKGQIVSIGADNQATVVDASTTPVKPSAGSAVADYRFDKAVDNAGKELGSHGKLFSAINMVEKELGFPLDNINDKGQVKQPDGSFGDVDLPGTNVWGLGRVTAHSPEARMLEGSIATIFNTELKDRSGAAVTDSELERLRVEFNAGKFNTEPEMLRALKRYKIKAAEVLANAEARYNPEVLAEYSGRGGFTSAKIKGDAGGATGQWDAPPEYTKEQALAEKERRQKAAAAAKTKSGGS